MAQKKTLYKYQYSLDVETLLHSAGGNQGSRSAHQAERIYERVSHELLTRNFSYSLLH